MGQMITRAANKAVTGRLDKGLQRYQREMEKDVLRNVQAKKPTAGGFTDPNAMEGFTRGIGGPYNVRDAEQEAFLKSRQSGGPQEMPEDLIQFLQDMGPVTRKKVGTRIRKHEMEELRGREKREMPIMEDTEFMTSRTTNFSRRIEEEDKFGMTARQLYQMLHAGDETQQDVDAIDASEQEKQEYLSLVQNTLKYVKAPVIMKDTDKSYVGAWPDSMEEMSFRQLKQVPESQVRILLAVEDPDEAMTNNTSP